MTPERLLAVERSEDALRKLGLREFRVRHHGDVARVETAPAEIAFALAAATAIQDACTAAGFRRVVLDVEGYRRGALNEGLGLVAIASRASLAPSLDRAAAALRHAGIGAELGVAGHASDILVIAAPVAAAGRIAAIAAELKAAGYRYVALEPRAELAA